ncbi:unnamed protein product [Ixodes pacificus]
MHSDTNHASVLNRFRANRKGDRFFVPQGLRLSDKKAFTNFATGLLCFLYLLCLLYFLCSISATNLNV